MLYLISFCIPILLMIGVYVYNWQNRLPIKQVLPSFFLGVVAVLLYFCWCIFTEEQIDVSSSKPDTLIQTISNVILHSAMPEEFIKWLVLSILLIIGHIRKLYNSHYNIIMCAVSISMGFAAFENIIYLLGNDHIVRTIVVRALMAVLGHCCDAIWMGYFYAIAKFEHSKGWWTIPMSIIVPVMIHFVHNLSIELISFVNHGWLKEVMLSWIPIYTIGMCVLSFRILKTTKKQVLY